MKNTSNKAASDKLIFALDADNNEDALSWVELLSGHVGMFKVGKELFTAVGPKIIESIKERNQRVFLDLKFHDIPNTVARAAEAAVRLNVDMFNVHASGGSQMIKEAVAALEAATKALFPTTPADLEKALRQIRDANDQPIPPTIVKGMLSTYHFRGAGEGVAHGSADGGRPTAALAEWVLTTAAASIIYLRDVALEIEDEEPVF